jgi:hypothetical protein
VSFILTLGQSGVAIDSHHIWNYDKANHKPPMLVRFRVMGKVLNGIVWPIKG